VKGLAFAALGFLAAGSTAAAPAEVLTLERAVELALSNNRQVGIAALEVDRAEQRLGAARTNRLPSLSVDGTAGTTLTAISVTYPAGSFGDFPGTGPIPAEDTRIESPRSLAGNVSATLAQPLSQLKRIGLGTKLSEISRDLEREKLREQRAAVAGNTRRLYYGLLQIESSLRAAESQVALYRELERVVGQRVAQEAALPSDHLDVRARLASAEYQANSLRNERTSGQEQLNHLLGRELTREFELAEVGAPTTEELDLASALSRAIERRPDLAQARLSVDRADTDLRSKKAESIPDVSLSVSYVSFVNVDLVPRNIAIAGLQVKWEPFDWGKRKRERAEKALQVEQAKSGARERESAARLEVSRSFRKLQEARLLLQAQALGRQAAEEKLRVVTNKHREESALLKDVLEAQVALDQATYEHDRALTGFWTARADLQQAIGEER
jgi:outer membrane protein